MWIKRFLLSTAVFLSLALGYTEQSVAQSTASQNVIGYWKTSGCPGGNTPCFVQYGDVIPVDATVSASVAPFEPNGNSHVLAVTDTSSDVALPHGEVVLVTNKGSNTAYIKLSVGGDTATTSDIALVAGASVGLAVGMNDTLSAVADTSDTTTLNIAGGSGLVSGFGGGSSGGGGGGGDVNITEIAGTAVTAGTGAVGAGSQRVAVARDTTTIAGAAPGTAGTASANVVTVQGVASMTPVQVSQATAGNLNATVVGTGTFATQAAQSGTWNITNVSGTVSLPTGASTAANQSTINTSINSVIGTKAAGTAATNSQLAGGVYNSSPPSPSNGQQTALQLDSSGNLKVNVASGGGSGGTSSNFNSSFPSTGTAVGASDGTNMKPLKVDSNGNLLVAGVGSAQGAAIAGQTLSPTACQNLTANPTAYTTAQTNIPTCDVYGGQVVQPYALSAGLVRGTITSDMTGTTSTSLVAAPGSGLKNYITQLTCWNSHATQGTGINIQDGSGGTTIYSIPAAALFGGAVISFPAPLQQPTANTALYVANITSGAATRCSASGFKAP